MARNAGDGRRFVLEREEVTDDETGSRG